MHRNLPTIEALQCFQATVRHGSFTRAAAELYLSQSAVSKQVIQLEIVLGKKLFHRAHNRLLLTPAGVFYSAKTDQLLDQMERSVQELHLADDCAETLQISTQPTFGARWLAPRLKDFYQNHSNLRLDIRNRPYLLDFDTDPADIKLFFGSGVLPNAECIKLMDEMVIPVCAPSLLSTGKINSPIDLTRFPLLKLLSRPQGWGDWFKAQGYSRCPRHQSHCFETFEMMLGAAVSEYGVALVPEFLTTKELEEDQLAIAWQYRLKMRDSYFVGFLKNNGGMGKVQTFISWLLQQT